MIRIFLPVIILSFCVSPLGSRAQEDSSTSAASLNPREKDELQARIYMAKKQYAEAAGVYSRLAQENPKDASYYNYLGIAQLQGGKLNEARKSFDRATKVDRRFADAYNNLGATYYAEKKYKNAITQYQRSLALKPNVASVYTNIGYAYFAEKKLPKAMEAFHEALALDPKVFEETGRYGSILSYRSVADRGLFNYMLAKDFAANGDAENCLVYLRRAADEGYKDLGKARTDPAFAKVIADPDVKALLDKVAPEPTPPPAPHS
ncbi:MAG TPA: tetratricopeptide repeat protein [Candidatus Acidoferrales bacterium]|jgi:tetratricopeptide (TPR) repeat protein|nr:tetratricopeptide repeat protein [Candidatus Acidoferrales bacterium]